MSSSTTRARNWNVIAVTTPGGDVAEEYQYQPYGLPQVKRHLAFGDSDADGDVDATDNTPHFTSLTTYNRTFDADFDGDVGNNVGDPDRDAWDASYNDPDAGTTMVVANRAFSPTGNPFLFTGRRLDAETGLYYYRFRTYHPGLKTFIQRDPLGYGDSASLYQYVGGLPTTLGDPLGLRTQVGKDEWHHELVDQFYKWFRSRGLDPDAAEFGRIIDRFFHRLGDWARVHRQWNMEWAAFIAAHPAASVDEILDFLAHLRVKYAHWYAYMRPAGSRYRWRWLRNGKKVVKVIGWAGLVLTVVDYAEAAEDWEYICKTEGLCTFWDGVVYGFKFNFLGYRTPKPDSVPRSSCAPPSPWDDLPKNLRGLPHIDIDEDDPVY